MMGAAYAHVCIRCSHQLAEAKRTRRNQNRKVYCITGNSANCGTLSIRWVRLLK